MHRYLVIYNYIMYRKYHQSNLPNIYEKHPLDEKYDRGFFRALSYTIEFRFKII